MDPGFLVVHSALMWGQREDYASNTNRGLSFAGLELVDRLCRLLNYRALFVVGPMNPRLDGRDPHFDAQDRRLGRLAPETNRRFDGVNARSDVRLETIVSFERRMSPNEGRIEVIREHIRAVDTPGSHD